MGMQFSQVLHFHFFQLFLKIGGVSTKALYLFLPLATYLCLCSHHYCPMYYSWNPKQPFINGCFNWMIPNLYVENGCFTKQPFINGCLGLQVPTITNQPRTVQPFHTKSDILRRRTWLLTLGTTWTGSHLIGVEDGLQTKKHIS